MQLRSGNAAPTGISGEANQWLLSQDDEPPIGAHVVTPRMAYVHHGIHVGGGKIVHYRAIWHGLRSGRVEEVALERFARGRPVYVRFAPSSFDARTIVARAYARLGERRYRLLTNNCEHLCEWCLRGRGRSLQVDAWRDFPRRLLRRLTLVLVELGRKRRRDALGTA
jgi:hypothetical protein